jgi:putative hydrolase
LIEAINKNPRAAILTHPDHDSFPLNFERLVPHAKKHGVALELNNACTMLKKSQKETTLKMLSICKETGCCIAVNSDAHTLNELGRYDAVTPYLEQTRFPEELIINSTPEKAISFAKNSYQII